MKKKVMTLALLTVGISWAAYAQTPANKTKSAIFDFSETWCTPCGAWGIDVIDSVEAGMLKEDIGYIIGVKNSSSPTTMNALGGQTMADNFEAVGVPAFIINNLSVNEGVTHNNTGDIERILTKVRTFDSTDAVAGIAAQMTITGNLLTVTAKSKFWNATSGDYYMSVMLVEDDISAYQNAYASNPAIHTNILRGPLATSGTALNTDPWGEFVGTSNITSGQEFTKIYKVTLDPSWAVNKLAAFAVIFKKNTNGVFEAVNIEKAVGNTTSISGLNFLNEVAVYPNPASDVINMSLSAAEKNVVNVVISDATGKLVYSQTDININRGANSLQIKTGNLSAGTYSILLSNNTGSLTSTLVIR